MHQYRINCTTVCDIVKMSNVQMLCKIFKYALSKHFKFWACLLVLKTFVVKNGKTSEIKLHFESIQLKHPPPYSHLKASPESHSSETHFKTA